MPAKTKNRPLLENVGGSILQFRSDDRRDCVLMYPTHAYSVKHLKSRNPPICRKNQALVNR
jgi:hypothetical protein